MRRALILFAFLFHAWATPSLAQSTTFLSTLEDIPLMSGLNELSEGAMHFDSTAGRIVDVYAAGPLKAQDVQKYYDETLPALGWALLSPNIYGREGERLAITSALEAGVLVVHFSLAPAKK